ncbi:MAG: SPW repeat protein [Bacteroidota bacterium]
MKLISIKLHSILDYVFGIILILSPWIFMFNKDLSNAGTPVIIGGFVIAYSLFTKYNYSLFKIIPFRFNLFLDVCCGFVLAVSPWIFHFEDIVYIPHVFLGIVQILLAANTNRDPRFSKLQMPE